MAEASYNLSKEEGSKSGLFKTLRVLLRYLKGLRLKMFLALTFLMINSLTVIAAPFLIGDTTNKYIPTGDKDNLLNAVVVLGAIYLVGSAASYLQIRIMGQVGQEILFKLRNEIFAKVQSLPLEFFNTNKSGDLISRINNDTEKLNQGFSETLLRFTGDIVVIIGIGIVMIRLDSTLGLIAWIALVVMVIVTFVLSPWIEAQNSNRLQRLGELSAEIQESLSNFKVTFVFNRREYFKESFATVNETHRKAATLAGVANGLLAPIYTYAGAIASMLILVTGIQLLIIDKFTAGQMPEFGTLLTFILYSSSFFGPLREMGELFTQMQTSIASWGRINKLLRLQSNLKQIETKETKHSDLLMKFDKVEFGYSADNMVLHDINLELEAGKTYALVGPTGGGKSTTASLMARLYDVSGGEIFFKGKDIRSYDPAELSKQIGVILQEPFLFTGTLADNVKYGNDALTDLDSEQLEAKLKDLGLGRLIDRFSEGLETTINAGAENISLGQRQLIAFVRILLREPQLLIMDEATANIDTVTEEILEDILRKLPANTTKVIIAHRLNTIENADQIFFISNGNVEKPLDFGSALDLINTAKRSS
jgi:ATP-binding cassette subfamily B protein